MTCREESQKQGPTPPFPWELLISWVFTAGIYLCYCHSCVAAVSAPGVTSARFCLRPAGLASWLHLGPASSLWSCWMITEQHLTQVSVSWPATNPDLLAWLPGSLLAKSLLSASHCYSRLAITLGSWLTFLCGAAGPCCSLTLSMSSKWKFRIYYPRGKEILFRGRARLNWTGSDHSRSCWVSPQLGASQ